MRNEEWWCGASYNESAADYWNHVNVSPLGEGNAIKLRKMLAP